MITNDLSSKQVSQTNPFSTDYADRSLKLPVLVETARQVIDNTIQARSRPRPIVFPPGRISPITNPLIDWLSPVDSPGTSRKSGFKLFIDEQTRRCFDFCNQPTVLQRHKGKITSLMVFPNGWVGSGSEDCTVHVWKPGVPNEAPLIFNEATSSITDILWLSSGRLLVRSNDRVAYLWNINSPNSRTTVIKGIGHPLIALSSDRIAWSSQRGDLSILNLTTREVTTPWEADNITNLTALLGSRIAWTNKDREACVYDPATPEDLMTFKGHKEEITSLIALPNGRIASGSARTIHVWNPDSRIDEPIIFNESSREMITLLATLPDSRIAFAKAWDNSVRIWNPTDPDSTIIILKGSEKHPKLEAAITRMIPLPNGRIASGSSGGTIQVWNLNTPNRAPTVFQGPKEGMTSLIALPDSRIIVGTKEGTLLIFGNSAEAVMKRAVKRVSSRLTFNKVILVIGLVVFLKFFLHLVRNPRTTTIG